MPLTPKKLFKLDSIGALISAFLLGVVLVNMEKVFGMPSRILYFLALVACIFAVYSFWHYRNIKENWQAYLKAIALANLAYCCLTIGLLFYFRQQLTILGFLYFGMEVLVIVSLAVFELKYVYKEN